jgi:gluconate 2-dehydrogenase gamma chain
MKGTKPPLSQSKRCLLEAVADRIFPVTDTPGAVEIGAVAYIENALASAYVALVPLYRAGLRAVDQHAKGRFGARFRKLNAAQQDAVLKDFESSTVPRFKRAADFFEAVRCHVLEGVFCEPQYGGNKDMTGWRLVGFPGQQFGYADPYINKRVDLEPVADRESE